MDNNDIATEISHKIYILKESFPDVTSPNIKSDTPFDEIKHEYELYLVRINRYQTASLFETLLPKSRRDFQNHPIKDSTDPRIEKFKDDPVFQNFYQKWKGALVHKFCSDYLDVQHISADIKNEFCSIFPSLKEFIDYAFEEKDQSKLLDNIKKQKVDFTDAREFLMGMVAYGIREYGEDMNSSIVQQYLTVLLLEKIQCIIL